MSRLICKYRTRKALRWVERHAMPAQLSATIRPYTMPKGRHDTP